MFRRIPLGAVLLVVGSILTVIGFVAYAQDNATLNLVGFFYGIPILLGGLALKAAELDPVPFEEPAAAVLTLRTQQATQNQNQIRKDVTRYRYGQEAHLDESLERLGLSPNDIERPLLSGLRETEISGTYALILTFDSPRIDLETWQTKREKIERFFGPNIIAEISQPETDKIELALITSLDPTPVETAA